MNRRDFFRNGALLLGAATLPRAKTKEPSDDDRFDELLEKTGAVTGGAWRLKRTHWLKSRQIVTGCVFVGPFADMVCGPVGFERKAVGAEISYNCVIDDEKDLEIFKKKFGLFLTKSN